MKLRIATMILVGLLVPACGNKGGPALVGDEDAGDTGGLDAGDAGSNVPSNTITVDLGTPDLGDCSPEREDSPDPFYFDSNCDGMDGDEAASVFVASYGDDLNPGTKALPKLTIQAAIDTAASEEKDWVLLSDGLHEGGAVLANGVGIAGGYNLSWDRDARFKTTVRGGNPAIRGAGIDEETLLIGFELEPTRMPQPGATSITILLENSPGVRLENLRIVGGVGGDGADGTDGANGDGGGTGGRGGNGREDSGSIGCSEDGKPASGAAGTSICDAANGGVGGEPEVGDRTGKAGGDSPAGAAGGIGGPVHQPGGRGTDGARGENGTSGAGGRAAGTFMGPLWVGESGQAGVAGDVGQGGGGGGGGGGGDSFCDSYGGAGGGGGAGGCGGTSGTGGQHGGASVGVFLIGSDIEILECTILGGAGGAGGQGGEGGQGGPGGVGGDGGGREDDSGIGGKGGVGGVGGRGGQGGAGAGGPSYGVYTSVALTTPPTNTEITVGSGGPGGLAASAMGKGEAGEAVAVKTAE